MGIDIKTRQTHCVCSEVEVIEVVWGILVFMSIPCIGGSLSFETLRLLRLFGVFWYSSRYPTVEEAYRVKALCEDVEVVVVV